jgi:hypothetical protein
MFVAARMNQASQAFLKPAASVRRSQAQAAGDSGSSSSGRLPRQAASGGPATARERRMLTEAALASSSFSSTSRHFSPRPQQRLGMSSRPQVAGPGPGDAANPGGPSSIAGLGAFGGSLRQQAQLRQRTPQQQQQQLQMQSLASASQPAWLLQQQQRQAALGMHHGAQQQLPASATGMQPMLPLAQVQGGVQHLPGTAGHWQQQRERDVAGSSSSSSMQQLRGLQVPAAAVSPPHTPGSLCSPSAGAGNGITYASNGRASTFASGSLLHGSPLSSPSGAAASVAQLAPQVQAIRTQLGQKQAAQGGRQH